MALNDPSVDIYQVTKKAGLSPRLFIHKTGLYAICILLSLLLIFIDDWYNEVSERHNVNQSDIFYPGIDAGY